MDYVYYIDTFIVYTQKNLLCIHKRSLVHAQHSCACSGPGTPGARDPKKALGRSQAWPRGFWALVPGFPGQEHAQECRACTRDLLCTHKRFLLLGLVCFQMICYIIIILSFVRCRRYDALNMSWHVHFDFSKLYLIYC